MLTITCNGTANAPVQLDSGFDLIVNGTIGGTSSNFTQTPAVKADGNNVVTINGSIGNAKTFTAPSIIGGVANVNFGDGIVAIDLGPGSTLNNFNVVDATNVFAIALSGTTSTGTFYLNTSAIAAQVGNDALVDNSGRISVLASNLVETNNTINFFAQTSIAAAYGIFGLGAPSHVVNADSHSINLVASQDFSFLTFSGADIYGATAYASAITLGTGSTVENHGSVTATSTSTFTFANGTAAQLYGPFSIFTAPTTFAAGIQVFYGADIENTATIFATATTNINVTGVNGASIHDSCCFGLTPQWVQAAAFGIYIGPTILPSTTGPVTYNLALSGLSDMIVNGGPIDVIATSTVRVTNLTGASFFNISSRAAGIEIVYPSFYQNCDFGDYCGSVTGNATIRNTGAINATGLVDFSFTLGDEPSKTISIQLETIATGIGVERIGAGTSNFTSDVDNTAAIKAIAHTVATVRGEDVAQFRDDFFLNSTAIGITANWQSTGGVTALHNSGPITAEAWSKLDLAFASTAGNVSLRAYIVDNSSAVGIQVDRALAFVNTGAISAIAASQVNLTATGDSTLNLLRADVTATAVGLAYNYTDTSSNNGAITAAAIASFNVAAPALPTFFGIASVPMNVVAVAEGVRPSNNSTFTNSAQIDVQATATLTLPTATGALTTGGVDAVVSAAARAITQLPTSDHNIVQQNGVLNATAVVNLNTPNFAFQGKVQVEAAGVFFLANSGPLNITNTNRISAMATANINWAADFNPFASSNQFFNHYAPHVAEAYGLSVFNDSVLVNNSTISVGSSVILNGTVLQGEQDASASFGVRAFFNSNITNNGLIETTRIGTNQWAIFTDLLTNFPGHGTLVVILNQGTTIGSIHLGEGGLTNAGTMIFRVLPSSTAIAPFGSYDRIVALGGTYFDTLNGTILIRPVGSPALFKPETIYPYFVLIGTVGGGINGLTAPEHAALKIDSAFFTVDLRDTPADAPYNPYGVEHTGLDLILTRIAFSTPLGVNLVGNQKTVGEGLENTLFTGTVDPNGKFAELLGAIQGLNPADVPSAYQQMAGEITANLSNFGIAIAGQMFEMILGRPGNTGKPSMNAATGQHTQVASLDLAAAVPGMPNASTPGVAHWQAWLGGYGQFGTIDGHPGISGVRYTVAGAVVGLEYAMRDVFRLGLALGGGAVSSHLREFDGNAKGQFAQAAIYGGLTLGDFYVDAAIGYARHWIDTERTVAFPGFFDRLQGNTAANQIMAAFEAGYRIDFAPFQVTPFVGAQLSSFFQDGYDETGGAAALRYHDRATTSFRPMLGVHLRADLKIDGMTISPYAKLAWAHELGDRASTVNTAFLAAPASTFHVYGAKRSRDSALATAGFELTYKDNYQIYAAYVGDIAARNASHAGTAGIRIRW